MPTNEERWVVLEKLGIGQIFQINDGGHYYTLAMAPAWAPSLLIFPVKEDADGYSTGNRCPRMLGRSMHVRANGACLGIDEINRYLTEDVLLAYRKGLGLIP